MSEFIFEQQPWERYIDSLTDRADALQLLTLLEEENEDTVQEALQLLSSRGIRLDLSDLPQLRQGGELAKRLQFEKKVAASGDLLGSLREDDPLKLYLQELARIPTTGVTEADLQKHLRGDSAASERLVNAMLASVLQEAMAFAGRGVLLLDLIQEGSLGLWEAISAYETGDFESCCLFRIRQAMAGALLLQARNAGLGQKLREGMQDYQDADQKLLAELGRNPTTEEIAEELRIPAEEAATLEKMLLSAKARRRMTAPREEEPEEAQQAVEDTAYFQSRQRVLDMLSELTQQEAKLICLRFGLEGGMPMSPQEVGEKLGLSPQQVVQTEAAALEKMRASQ